MWVTRQIGHLNTVADGGCTSDETIFACDRQRETDARVNEWGPAGHAAATRGHRSGVPLLLQHFQLSPGTLVTIYERDLPTLRILRSAPAANLFHRPPNYIRPTPTTLVTPWPLTHSTSWQGKPQCGTCKTIYVLCMLSRLVHPQAWSGPPALTVRGSVVIL